jgi:hypothetical protein
LKEYATIIASAIAAIASVVTLLINMKLTTSRERRKALWERELDKFIELEEKAGSLVEDLLSYRCRDDCEKQTYFEKQQYLLLAAGRFRRYPEVLSGIYDLQNRSGWYFSQDMKHESRKESQEATTGLITAYDRLLVACDKVLGRRPQKFKFSVTRGAKTHP